MALGVVNHLGKCQTEAREGKRRFVALWIFMRCRCHICHIPDIMTWHPDIMGRLERFARSSHPSLRSQEVLDMLKHTHDQMVLTFQDQRSHWAGVGSANGTKSDSETPLDSKTRDSETARQIQKLLVGFGNYIVEFRNYVVGFRKYSRGFRNYC